MTPKPHTWYILKEEKIDDTFQDTLLYVVKKEGKKWKHYVLFLDTFRVRTDKDREEFFVSEDEFRDSKEWEEPFLHYVKEITLDEAMKKLNFFPRLKTNLFKHIFNE